MNARLLALALGVASAAPGAVFRGHDPALAFRPIADKVHGMVIGVRGFVAVSSDGGEPTVETLTHGTGALLGKGIAVTTLHAVALPSPEGRMTPLPRVEVLVPEKGAMPAQVIAGIPDLDLAILELAADGAALEGAPPAVGAPAPGDPLLAMAIDDDGVIGVGIEVASVDGDLLSLHGKRMLDSRFWGGPLFDSHGHLAGIGLMSLAMPKAISVGAIQRLVEERMRAQVHTQ
jgi:hypothetical protein